MVPASFSRLVRGDSQIVRVAASLTLNPNEEGSVIIGPNIVNVSKGHIENF
jgi:hypothetical protein